MPQTHDGGIGAFPWPARASGTGSGAAVRSRRPTPAAAQRLAQQLAVSPRTVARWRQWWRDSFPVTNLWQSMCARFMPPLDLALLPAALLARFTGDAYEAMRRFSCS